MAEPKKKAPKKVLKKKDLKVPIKTDPVPPMGSIPQKVSVPPKGTRRYRILKKQGRL